VNKGLIGSIYAHLNPERRLPASAEIGQALPIVLAALALGIMVVAPFLSHASASLVSAQDYRQILCEQYSADAGIEQAIWRLTQDNLAEQIPAVDDRTSYTLSAAINNLHPVITVTRLSSENQGKEPQKAPQNGTQDCFKIESRAGSTLIAAAVVLEDGTARIESWQMEK
jgi:hypothetical protein